MGIEKREVEFAKEIDDVGVLLVQIVRDAKAGKSAMEIASGSVGNLLNALTGVDQLPAEVKANRKVALQTIGFRTGELTDAILEDAPAPVRV